MNADGLLPREVSEVLAGRFNVGGACLLGRVEYPEVNSAPTLRQVRPVSPLHRSLDALVSAALLTGHYAAVALVLTVVGGTQIGKAIVESVAVYVINLQGFFAGNQLEDNPVGVARLPLDFDCQVLRFTALHGGARSLPRETLVVGTNLPARPYANPPRQDSSFRVVIEKLFESFLGWQRFRHGEILP